MYTECHRSKLHTRDCTVYGQCELSDVTVESMIAAEKAAAEKAAAEAAAAAETVVVETVVTSPKTVDAAVIAAIAAIVSGAGYMAAKKH